MTKDDKLLRETVLAELKRRRGLSDAGEARGDGRGACERRAARPGFKAGDDWLAGGSPPDRDERHEALPGALPAGTTSE